jgi:hypothetical protein
MVGIQNILQLFLIKLVYKYKITVVFVMLLIILSMTLRAVPENHAYCTTSANLFMIFKSFLFVENITSYSVPRL